MRLVDTKDYVLIEKNEGALTVHQRSTDEEGTEYLLKIVSVTATQQDEKRKWEYAIIQALIGGRKKRDETLRQIANLLKKGVSGEGKVDLKAVLGKVEGLLAE